VINVSSAITLKNNSSDTTSVYFRSTGNSLASTCKTRAHIKTTIVNILQVSNQIDNLLKRPT